MGLVPTLCVGTQVENVLRSYIFTERKAFLLSHVKRGNEIENYRKPHKMEICICLPQLNIREDEIKILLAAKLLEEEMVSLGKAAEIAGYSEKTFAEILIHRNITPIRYSDIDVNKEFENA